MNTLHITLITICLSLLFVGFITMLVGCTITGRSNAKIGTLTSRIGIAVICMGWITGLADAIIQMTTH